MKKLINNFLQLEKKDQVMFLLIFPCITNGILSIYQLFIGFISGSIWLLTNSAFYIIITLARFFSIKDYRLTRICKDKNKINKINNRNYFSNGLLLFLLSFTYFGVSTYMLLHDIDIIYKGYMVYCVATISFWNLGWAITGMIKYKKDISPIIRATRITNCANAMTSIVLTQVVLLSEFGEGTSNIFNGIAGITVSIIILAMGIIMMINTKKKELK